MVYRDQRDDLNEQQKRSTHDLEKGRPCGQRARGRHLD